MKPKKVTEFSDLYYFGNKLNTFVVTMIKNKGYERRSDFNKYRAVTI